mgnify:CR=1 FL=1
MSKVAGLRKAVPFWLSLGLVPLAVLSVTPLQGQGDGRCLHRGRLDKFKLGHGFEQAFVQGELGKHGCYLEDMQKNSCIG